MNVMQAILLIKKVYELGEKSVTFENKQTKCPVCEFLHVYEEGSVQVITTRGEIRYCKCKKCGTNIKAVLVQKREEKQKKLSSKILDFVTEPPKNIKRKSVRTSKTKTKKVEK